MCHIKFRNIKRVLRYTTEEEAAETYDKIWLYLLPDKQPLNFPEKLYNYKGLDLEEFYNDTMVIKRVKTSKYWGVVKCGKYYSARFINGITDIFLGNCKTEIEAAEIHDKYRFYHTKGSILKINYPETFKDKHYTDFENFCKERLESVERNRKDKERLC